mmetsp:Transcript_15394/g.36284  ORF Transcript_15394/g.36284 Transcript_15394/m.36284 type:complete len:316 (+) Transcript_15394:2162-3109(+)
MSWSSPAAAGGPSMTTHLAKTVPSSETKRPRTDTVLASSQSPSIQVSRWTSVRARTFRQPATTACIISLKSWPLAPVTSFESVMASLRRSAQARQRSRLGEDGLPMDAMTCAACLSSGFSCRAPCRMISAQKRPPLAVDFFCARSAGLACCRLHHLAHARKANIAKASVLAAALDKAFMTNVVWTSMFVPKAARRSALAMILRFDASSGMHINNSSRQGNESSPARCCTVSVSQCESSAAFRHNWQSTMPMTSCLRTVDGPFLKRFKQVNSCCLHAARSVGTCPACSLVTTVWLAKYKTTSSAELVRSGSTTNHA